jgi:hypothetical protein
VKLGDKNRSIQVRLGDTDSTKKWYAVADEKASSVVDLEKHRPQG